MDTIKGFVKEFLEISRINFNDYEIRTIFSPRTCLVFTSTFLASYLLIKNNRQQYSIIPRWPPGPKPWPVIGNILSIKATKEKCVLERFQDLASEYGDLVHINIGMGIDIVYLTGTDLIYEAYVKKGDIFSNRPQHTVRNAKEKGILFQHGEPWKKIKNFTMKALKDLGLGKQAMEIAIQEEAKHVVNCFLSHKGEPINPKFILFNGVSNIICYLLFNKRYDYGDEKFLSVLKNLETLFANSGSKNLFRYFLPEFILKYFYSSIKRKNKAMDHMKTFVNEIIEEHREDFDDNNLRDFTDFYLQSKNDKNDDKISDENLFCLMCELFGAGSETTSTTLNWMILFLIRNPLVQYKCRQQIHKVIGMDRTPIWKDREQLPYIEAMIQETIRLANILPFSASHCTSEPVEIGGYLLPEKTMILCNVTSSLTSEEYWEDADVFKPERWLTDDLSKMKKNISKSFIPFGIGPRACPGENLARLELFIFSCSMLQRLKFEPESKDMLPSIKGVLKSTQVPQEYRTLITLLE